MTPANSGEVSSSPAAVLLGMVYLGVVETFGQRIVRQQVRSVDAAWRADFSRTETAERG
jgi:hypothetical protein